MSETIDYTDTLQDIRETLINLRDGTPQPRLGFRNHDGMNHFYPEPTRQLEVLDGAINQVEQALAQLGGNNG